jgi:nitrogen-specific signal transduction histidine kinase
MMPDGMKQLLDDLPFYVLLVDDEHKIHYVNNTVRQYLQVGSREIIGGYCPKIIHNYDGPFPDVL